MLLTFRDMQKKDQSINDGDENKLEKLEQQLYAREEMDDLKERNEDLDQLGLRKTVVPNYGGKKPPISFKKIADRTVRNRKILLGTVAGILLVALFVGGVTATLWYRSHRTVTEKQVKLTLNGPQELSAGNEMVYSIMYRNDSYVNWENVEVLFEMPDGFTFGSASVPMNQSGRDLVRQTGGLKSGEEGEIKVTGALLAEEQASVVAKAQISITPENFPSGRFSAESLLATTIAAVPLDLSLEAPQEAAPGERILTTLRVTNKSDYELSNVQVVLNPAVGMTLAPDDPGFSADFDQLDNNWLIPSVAPLETQTRQIVYYLDGQAGEQRTLEAIVKLIKDDQHYEQRRISAITTVAAATLSLSQQYQDSDGPLVAEPGEKISGIIHFFNEGTLALKDAIVRVAVEGEGFDPAALKLTHGAYDPTTKVITWTSATVPELALIQPNTGGDITYEFAIKSLDGFPAEAVSKNNTITLIASIDSPDVTVPVGQERVPVSDRFVFSVASDLVLNVDAYYDDGRLGIKSTGPVPPKVGEETTYTVRLRVGSTLNDLGDVQIRAVLPDGVRFTQEKILTTGQIEYNDRTGEILWRIPEIVGLTGRAMPPAELQLQVAVLPAENQRQQIISFLNNLSGSATDIFTNNNVTVEVKSYPSTETAQPKQGKVE